MEMFGNISEMISHWEGEEKILKGEGEGGERRRSKVEELSLVFEGENVRILPYSMVGGGGEGSRNIEKCKVGPNSNSNTENVPLRIFQETN